jgi:tRNA threonylcarbamoyladenosine biosynthesis protein TsaE
MEILTTSVEQTLALGESLGAVAPRGVVITLSGALGAGKTHFVRGLARGARVADPDLVSSPTYVFLNIYSSDDMNPESKTVYHLDAYRASSCEDFTAVGFEELLQDDAITVVEWPERIRELLPPDRIAIAIETEGETERRFVIEGTGAITQQVVERLEQNKPRIP